MIKLIATDLDGTLLKDHETIHEDNLSAIREAQRRGALFAIASGRNIESCYRLLERHGIQGAAVIAMNGCQIAESLRGGILRVRYIDSASARATMRIFAENGLDACLCTEDDVLYPTAQARLSISGKTGPGDGERIEPALRGNVFKTFCICKKGQEAAFARAREECGRLPGVYLTRSWADNFEVMPKGVDKGEALRSLAESLGIAPGEIMAFGDYENDLEMLRYAGHSYAMGNATEAVKAAARHITGRCREGGVAQAIDRSIDMGLL